MKNLITFFIGMIFFVYANAQTPDLNWDKIYNGPISETDRITDMDFDPVTGNTYVTGVSDSISGPNYVTIKYSPTGQMMWRSRFYGPRYQDSPNAIKYDPLNNTVYVTGKSKGVTTNYDWLTIRYNASTGDTVWTKRYNGSLNGDDEAKDMDIDASGNIYVVGNVFESCNDHINAMLIKYTPTGNVTWSNSITRGCYYDIVASKVAVNADKVVVITNEHKTVDYYAYVIGYFISDGSCSTYPCYGSSIQKSISATPPESYGIAFDGLGNVYISGGDYGDIVVTKLNTNFYSKVWQKYYNGSANKNDWANNIVVDQNNYYVYVTGYSQNSSGINDIITIKYNDTGDTIWTRKYNGTGKGDDKGLFIAKDNLTNPNIYVTGYTTQASGKKQITTLKYNNSGNQLWALDYGCSTNDNVPVGMFKDANNYFYISGYNNCNGTNEDFFALKYCTLPGQAGSITGSTTVCAGTSQTYSISTLAGATSYIWTLPTGAIGTSTTNSITVNYGTSAVSGNITVKGHNDCGDGTASALAVTLNPLPAGAETITGQTSVCQGQNSVTYTVPITTNTNSYNWTLPTGVTGTSTTNSITVNYGKSAVSGNITVKGLNDCGDGSVSVLAITVNPLPAGTGTIAGPKTVCQGQNSVTYTAPATNATSYIWTLPTGATGSSSTNTITVNFGASAVSGNITLKGNNSCGDGSTSILTVVVNPIPAIPVITLNGNVLHSNTVSENQWYNQNGLVNGATTQDYTPVTSGDYYVIVTSNGCSSNSSNSINYIPTGINPTESVRSIKVYPNPVYDELVIEIAGNLTQTKFEIVNSVGQSIFNGTMFEKTVVKTSGFATGVYLIKLESGKTFEFKKIIKN